MTRINYLQPRLATAEEIERYRKTDGTISKIWNGDMDGQPVVYTLGRFSEILHAHCASGLYYFKTSGFDVYAPMTHLPQHNTLDHLIASGFSMTRPVGQDEMEDEGEFYADGEGDDDGD